DDCPAAGRLLKQQCISYPGLPTREEHMEHEGQAQESAARPPGGQERRAAPRHPSSLKIACYPVGTGFADRRQARIRNISLTGIGIVLDRSWPPGTILILELPGEEAMRTVRARVVHATTQVGGTFLVGCTFLDPMTDAEVQALTT